MSDEGHPNGRVLGFYDISRAHFHSPVRRVIYIIPPKEDSNIKTGCARLLKSMYGTRDAAQCFDAYCEKSMSSLGFRVGEFSPCIYSHAERTLVCYRHGDDFVLLGSREDQLWFYKGLNEHMLCKHTGSLGPAKTKGDIQEIRCLNRLIRFVQPPYKGGAGAYVEWEPDPRHAEILMSALGLKENSKPLKTPGLKQPKGADESPLGEEHRALYRSCTMRYSYLAQDRPDIQYSAKELARSMQSPTKWDKEQLKRAVRYLIGSRRMVQRFERQVRPTQLVVYSDSDHAGCLKTRKSTSCTMVFHGKHLIRSTSTTQAVISLSSGESEFYAAVKAGSVGLGIRSLLKDMGIEYNNPVELRMDATAGLGVAARRGAGRIRHIHTPSLWLQRAVSNGVISLAKVPGESNPADIGTKHVEQAVLRRMLQYSGFRSLSGTSDMALRAST